MLDTRDSLTITVSTVNTSKSYNVSQAIKKFAIYVVLIVVVALIATGVFVHYLQSKVSSIQSDFDQIKQEKYKVESDLQALQSSNLKLNQEIKSKETRLSQIAQDIKDIEDTIDLDNVGTSSIEQRIDTAKLSLLQKTYLLQLIPNGTPLSPNTKTKITSSFGIRRHPIQGQSKPHEGIDIQAKIGTPVYATADGIVKHANYTDGYGNTIIIDHAFGFRTLYAHLNLKARGGINVKPYEYVKKGDLIGYSGSTGKVTGPHLHYEITYVYTPQNPVSFLKWNLKNYDDIFKKGKKINWQGILDLSSKNLALKQLLQK